MTCAALRPRSLVLQQRIVVELQCLLFSGWKCLWLMHASEWATVVYCCCTCEIREQLTHTVLTSYNPLAGKHSTHDPPRSIKYIALEHKQLAQKLLFPDWLTKRVMVRPLQNTWWTPWKGRWEDLCLTYSHHRKRGYKHTESAHANLGSNSA